MAGVDVLQEQQAVVEDQAERKRLKRVRSIDEQPWSGPKGVEVSVANSDVSVTVLPQDAGRISSIRVFGYELLRQYQSGMDIFGYGAFSMVPWVGRIGGGLLYHEGITYQLPLNQPGFAIHGFGRLGAWNVDEHTESAVGGRIVLGLDLSPWWPWKARAQMIVELDGTMLHVTQTLQAVDSVFPGQIGLHPWFRRHLADDESDRELDLDFDPQWQAQRGVNYLPTGRRIAPTEGPWDDAFGFFPTLEATLSWQQLEARMSSNYAYGTVFSQIEDALCVEPETSLPNAINARQGTELVSPDKPMTLTTEFSFARL